MDSLRLLLDPATARRLQRCGIVMLDSASDVIPTILRYLGKDPNSTSAEDLREVERTLMAIRPFIRAFSSGGVIDQLCTLPLGAVRLTEQFAGAQEPGGEEIYDEMRRYIRESTRLAFARQRIIAGRGRDRAQLDEAALLGSIVEARNALVGA
jgi:hypothetical protein